jgi:hypothetical protein
MTNFLARGNLRAVYTLAALIFAVGLRNNVTQAQQWHCYSNRGRMWEITGPNTVPKCFSFPMSNRLGEIFIFLLSFVIPLSKHNLK